VPFETGRRTIDLLGLNEPRIASATRDRRGADTAFAIDWVLDQRPTWLCENFRVSADLVATSRLSDDELRALGAYKTGQRALLRSPRLAALYEVDPQAPFAGTCMRVRRP
jgi:hypothetical protein